MEASQRRGGGGGGMVPISPSQTPRSSDKAVRDLRSGEGSFSGKHDKDKGVNVQVIVRCRPLSEDEVRLHTHVVISCNDSRREVCAVHNIANKQIDRTFLFDKVFGPSSQQKDLYDQAVCPIVFEVLEEIPLPERNRRCHGYDIGKKTTKKAKQKLSSFEIISPSRISKLRTVSTNT